MTPPSFAAALACLVLSGAAFALEPGSSERVEKLDHVPVFTSGDGYHTYRIPALVVTDSGTLVALCEGRNARGDHAQNDIVCRRSEDGGRTWGPRILVDEAGDDTLGNTTLVVDGATGRIFALYNRFANGFHTDRCAPGYDDPTAQRNLVAVSDDDGRSWSAPRDVTRDVKREDVHWGVFTPGQGIQLSRGPHAGRLIVPMIQARGPERWIRRSYVAYSDDHGATWAIGDEGDVDAAPRADNAAEPIAVELEDGGVLLNCRNNSRSANPRYRRVATSRDGGATFEPARDDDALPDPNCQGTILRHRFPAGDEPGVLVFANPATTRGRKNGTVRLSYDEGATWPVARVIEPGPFAYSSLARLPDGSLGLLYEADDYGTIQFVRFTLEWVEAGGAPEVPGRPDYTIPTVDLAAETHRQVVVDREPGQYLGHPTTVLLEDQRTMIAVYPKGHGRGGIVMKRSGDGGLTWSERLPVPESWATSKEVPTIYPVEDREGRKRLIMFSGLYPIRMSVSEDDGITWSELEPIGDFGGIVAMGCVIPVSGGDYLALFHDDGRFIAGAGKRGPFYVYATRSTDGGLTWSDPWVIADHPEAHLCEPGFVRSPDGGTIAVLLRENSRRFNSFVIFSDDEGATWSKPRQVPAALTGDRHTGRYAPDGRLFVTFRDTTRESATQGDWVGWVGTWDDIVHGREGEYRVRLMDNRHRWDCAYPGLELLPDGTFVTTTYGHWVEGEQPFVVSVRFRMDELDARVPAEPEDVGLATEVPYGLPDAIEASWSPMNVAELGRHLFFDPVLSVDRSVSCASCHDPSTGFADTSALSLGVGGQKTLRNAPTLLNRVLGESFMWDGRAATLEEQVLQPIENEREMGLSVNEAVARLAADDDYVARFKEAFGAPPSRDGLASALAEFVRRLVMGDSPVDRFRAADRASLSRAARSGLWLYESRGRCWRCHSGANFTDEGFHNTGVGVLDGVMDEGRAAVTGASEDRGKFKTPTLRGVALTAPYMHDGSVATLEDVVEFYRQGGHPNANLDPAMKPLDITDEDAANLVAFLRALSERAEVAEED